MGEKQNLDLNGSSEVLRRRRSSGLGTTCRQGWPHPRGHVSWCLEHPTAWGPMLPVELRPCASQPSTLSLKARQTTAFWWPLYSLLISPVSTHHSLARLSEEAGNGIDRH